MLLMLGILAGFVSMTPTGAFAVNLPAQWDFPTELTTKTGTLELNLAQAFFDPDGDPLSFTANPSQGVSAQVSGNLLIAHVEKEGEIVLAASDGKTLTFQTITIKHT